MSVWFQSYQEIYEISQSSNGILELSSKICTEELMAMLPLDEQSCEDQTFVVVFFYFYIFLYC